MRPYSRLTCEAPGTGSAILIGLGLLPLFLSFVLAWAVIAWNRVWRIVTTEQSLGKRVTSLKVIDDDDDDAVARAPATGV